MSDKIPVTVGILTRNNEATLARALTSVSAFDDILLCDGGSDDGTLKIGAEFGAHVIPQDSAFKNEEGRIVDYAGIRNSMLKAAHHDWVFMLDSDEVLTPELVAEIRERIMGPPAVCMVPRLYELNGVRVMDAASYPNAQPRFFSRAGVVGYVKPVHERLERTFGTPIEFLKKPMLVPVEYPTLAMYQKMDRYVALEFSRHVRITPTIATRYVVASLKNLLRLSVKIVWGRITKAGPHLPLSIEATELYYHARLGWRAFIGLFIRA